MIWGIYGHRVSPLFVQRVIGEQNHDCTTALTCKSCKASHTCTVHALLYAAFQTTKPFFTAENMHFEFLALYWVLHFVRMGSRITNKWVRLGVPLVGCGDSSTQNQSLALIS